MDVGGNVSQESLIRNYVYLSQSDLTLGDDADKEIWDFIQVYAANYSALPMVGTIQDFLESYSQTATALDRLSEIASFPTVYDKADFENLVAEEINAQKDHLMHRVLKTAAAILLEGQNIKEGKETITYRGHRGAMQYIMKHADNLLMGQRAHQTKSNLPYDSQAVRDEFNRVLSAQHQSWGIITGLNDIDHVCRGIKPGELWIHAGFVGEFKTGFALNWVYRAVFLLQWNVYYLSLEMPVDQIRRIIYVMHSMHPKFQDKGFPKITYRLIRDGEDDEGNPITDAQKEFFELVIQDIEDHRGTSYGSLIVRSPDEEMTVSKLRADMEVTHQQTPIHMGVVDHFALMTPEKEMRSDYYTGLNSIVRSTKRLALSFNNGERIPILGLLQINRQGKLEAEKNDGVYKMQALADANEAERSADVITTSFLSLELRNAKAIKWGNLKNRDNPHFLPFTCNVDWDTRFLFNDFYTSASNDEELLSIETQEEMAALIGEEMKGGR